MRQVFNRFYRLEIHSLMFVFLTHLLNCCLSNLLADGPLPPPFLSVLHAYILYSVHGKYKGGGWSLVDLRDVGFHFLNRGRLKYNFHSQFKIQCHHMYFTFLTQCPTQVKNLAWTSELDTQLPEST
jgi:hypothetical protein